LGSGIETPIRDIIQIITEHLGYQGEVIWDATKPEGNKGRALDVSCTEKELGFVATTNLKDGMKKTIDWYLENSL
jgi:GDP-L-fucose synthase